MRVILFNCFVNEEEVLFKQKLNEFLATSKIDDNNINVNLNEVQNRQNLNNNLENNSNLNSTSTIQPNLNTLNTLNLNEQNNNQ